MSQVAVKQPLVGLTLTRLDSIPFAAWRAPGIRAQVLYSWEGRQVVEFGDNILYAAGEAWTITICGYVLSLP